MTVISEIKARQVLDSRGNPTIETDVISKNGNIGRAIVPSGASTGKYEAVELRDNNPELFLGKGVLTAVNNVNSIISRSLVGISIDDQETLDNKLLDLDGTPNKSNLGANSLLSVSMAFAKLSALENKRMLFDNIGLKKTYNLPVPMMNILNGGSHADNNIDFQEFMIMPFGANSFNHALRMGTEIFHNLKSVLKDEGYSTNVGDEGGFAPNLKSNQ